MFRMQDYYAGLEDEHELEFECEITDPGYRRTYDEPGCDPEFDVVNVYMDGAPVRGAQRKYLIESRRDLLQETANQENYDDTARL